MYRLHTYVILELCQIALLPFSRCIINTRRLEIVGPNQISVARSAGLRFVDIFNWTRRSEAGRADVGGRPSGGLRPRPRPGARRFFIRLLIQFEQSMADRSAIC